MRTLEQNEIESNLTALECTNCQGRWIQSFQYWKWRDALGKDVPEELPVQDLQPEVKDSSGGKLCPECGHILIRHPVGHGISFQLDRCGNCGGVWFDKNEWETLKERNLHDDVHLIFSTIWQKQVREEDHKKAMENFYENKFGSADYAKAKEIKSWIDNHTLKSELQAFIIEE
jgi:Zn-finger nucleic acid-binding protein